jgi:capsular exopolysaccharide synthesis family protein
MDLGDRSIKYNILKREVEANRNLYNALLQRLKEEDTSATASSNVAVVDTATRPATPVQPNVPRTLALALLLGLVVGTSAAYAAEFWDDTIKLPDDLRDRLNIARIGVIPKTRKGEAFDTALDDAGSPITEAYYSVRTALQFSTADGVPRSVLFSSSRAGEGKTSSALAVARNLAALGLNVVLIDADLRNPTLLSERFRGVGLAGILVGSGSIEREVVPTDVEKLHLLPAGTVPPNPADLLASSAFGGLVRQLEGAFDVVVVDGPPVLGLADAPLIASVCGATVLVCEAGRTRRTVALDAIARLRIGGANLIGGILTKYSDRSAGYGYGYGYGQEAFTYGGSGGSKKILGRPTESPSIKDATEVTADS